MIYSIYIFFLVYIYTIYRYLHDMIHIFDMYNCIYNIDDVVINSRTLIQQSDLSVATQQFIRELIKHLFKYPFK